MYIYICNIYIERETQTDRETETEKEYVDTWKVFLLLFS